MSARSRRAVGQVSVQKISAGTNESPGLHPPNPKDSGDEMAAELEDFKRPLGSVPMRKYAALGSVLVLESLLMGSQMIGTFVVNTAGQILLNYYGTTSDQAAMGLALAYHLWFYYGMLIAIYEKFGIDWSRSFGAKQYHLTRTYLYQAAIVLFTTFTFITLPAFWFSEEILLAIGTVPSQAIGTARVLRLFLVATVIASAEELLKNFSMAQGHESVFGKAILLAIIPSLAAAYWFIKVAGHGVIGWVYSKIIYEAINLVTSAIVLIVKTHPETWGKISLKPVLTGLGQYFVDSFKYALGSYTEYIGYLIGNYFVILTHDENQIAAFTIVQNVGGIVATLGEAFATIMRTRMNILIGKKENTAAKTFMVFFYWLMAVVSLLFTVTMYLFRENIAVIHTGSNQALYIIFCQILLLQVAYTPYHMILPCTGIGMKTIGQVDRLVYWTFWFYVVASGIACTCLHFAGLMNSVVAFAVVGVAANILMFMTLYITCSEDWTKIELCGDDDDEKSQPAPINDRDLEQQPLLQQPK